MLYSTKLFSNIFGRLTVTAARYRARVRAREVWLVVLAAATGSLAGALVAAVSGACQLMHHLSFGLLPGHRLSAAAYIHAYPDALIPAFGGLVLGISTLLLNQWRPRAKVDPIEANALHGGRMSLTDSLIVTLQTVISNGFGASVGLEAGYTQIGSGFASRIGSAFRLRRNDMRVLVGCGSAGAIAAAFNAPLTGAFYGFEIIIGTYSVATVAPVMAASLAAVLTARALGQTTYVIEIASSVVVHPVDYAFAIAMGAICGGLGILVMRTVAVSEQLFRVPYLPAYLRPALGGLLVGALALISPQVLSSGHGALHLDIATSLSIGTLAALILMKILASSISLGSGFRGGLFFASLLIGALLGKLIAAVSLATGLPVRADPVVFGVICMGGLAVAIVGGPLTMAFLALETTGDFGIAGTVIAASMIASITVRETFGYSFSTWRFHLRGESIRSAHDISWLRLLTVGRIMRHDVRTAPASLTLSEFREHFPLGSTSRVIMTDDEGRYQGIILVPEAYTPASDALLNAPNVEPLLHYRDEILLPGQNVKEAMTRFDTSESEGLAVVDDPASRHVVGLLTEAYAIRRYAEELDKVRRGLSGEN